jgi:regulator of protease activity HflC (stomatin/prohibitin superfamily)
MFKRTVSEFQTAILWRKGKIVELLQPGQYIVLPFSAKRLERFDMRIVPLRISGQEVILADRTSLKINVAGTYQLTDPIKRVKQVANEQILDYLNQVVQLTLREAIADYTLETLFEKKKELNDDFAKSLTKAMAEIGINVLTAGIKDIILPADLRAAYVESAAAQTRAKAQLEYARGQSAALRNLANSASLIEEHPQLIQLLSIQKTDKAAQSQVNLHFNDKK